MFGWMKRRTVTIIAQDTARIEHMRQEREKQQAMDRERRDLFYSLGFDLSDDSQSWLRQAQLMKQFDDDIRDLRDRVSQLEGR